MANRSQTPPRTPDQGPAAPSAPRTETSRLARLARLAGKTGVTAANARLTALVAVAVAVVAIPVASLLFAPGDTTRPSGTTAPGAVSPTAVGDRPDLLDPDGQPYTVDERLAWRELVASMDSFLKAAVRAPYGSVNINRTLLLGDLKLGPNVSIQRIFYGRDDRLYVCLGGARSTFATSATPPRFITDTELRSRNIDPRKVPSRDRKILDLVKSRGVLSRDGCSFHSGDVVLEDGRATTGAALFDSLGDLPVDQVASPMPDEQSSVAPRGPGPASLGEGAVVPAAP